MYAKTASYWYILILNETTRCKPGHILHHHNQDDDGQSVYKYQEELTLAKQVNVIVDSSINFSYYSDSSINFSKYVF